MEIVVGVVLAVVLVLALAWRLRYSLGLADAARRRPLTGNEQVLVVALVLTALGLGLWFGLR